MSDSTKARSHAKRGSSRFPVRGSVVGGFIAAVIVYIILFTWFGLAERFHADIEAWPEFWANLVLYDRWHPVVSWIFGIVFAMGFLALAYLLIMICYLFVKRRFPTKKFSIEIIFISIAILMSWGFKVAVLFQTVDQVTLKTVLFAVLGGFYATLGGLSFEGLPADVVTSVALICFYYGSSVVAGLSFIGIIASRAAYEFYSYLLLSFLKTKGKDIYVFTALNDETINLANSIVEDPDREKAANALIIFSGSSLNGFDHHEKNCLEVMAHGYIYWSVSAKEKQTILDRLFRRGPLLRLRGSLEKSADGKPRRGLLNWLRSHFRKDPAYGSVTIFAFDSDDDHIPNEEENMDYVLLDVRNRIELMETVGAPRRPEFVDYLRREKDIAEMTAELKEIRALSAAVETAYAKQRASELGDEIARLGKLQDATFDAAKAEYAELCRRHNIAEDGDGLSDEEFLERNRRRRALDVKRGFDVTHASYYIMTKRHIDYQAYQDKISSLEDRFRSLFLQSDLECFIRYVEMNRFYETVYAPKQKRLNQLLAQQRKYDDSDEKFAEALEEIEKLHFEEDRKQYEDYRAKYNQRWTTARPFTIHVWNEADSIAQEAQAALHGDPDLPFVPNHDATWMVSIGFGMNGQSMAKSLYTSSAMVGDDGVAATFRCDVFDPRGITEIAGLFAIEVPYAVTLSLDTLDGKPVHEAYREKAGAIFNQIATAADLPSDEVELRNALRKEMRSPLFFFHDGGVGQAGFENLLSIRPEDMDHKPSPDEDGPRFPDYVVIATGDDYESIRACNALAGLLESNHPPKPVTLFVNIWDDKNNNLVEGFTKASSQPGFKEKGIQSFFFAPNVRIVIVGNNEDIYRYDHIFDDGEAINYHRVYSRLANVNPFAENETFNRQAHEFFVNPSKRRIAVPKEATKFVRNYDGLWDTLDEKTKSQAHADWRSTSLWKRVSSTAAYRYGPTFYEMLRSWNPLESLGVFFTRLSCIEHQRWMRFHIADGWVYSRRRNDRMREHPCLLPVAYIPQETLCYDLFNVFVGIAIQMERLNQNDGLFSENDWVKVHRLHARVIDALARDYIRDARPREEGVTMACFGFDAIGEAIAEATFVATTDFVTPNKDGAMFNPFTAMVYASDRYGVYRAKHRFAVVSDGGESGLSEPKIVASIRRGYVRDFSRALPGLSGKAGEKAILREMTFPTFVFQNLDPTLPDAVFELVDSWKHLPDYISIAMPSDEMTMTCFRRLMTKIAALQSKANNGFLRDCTVFAYFRDSSYAAQATTLARSLALDGIKIRLLRDDGPIDGAAELAALYYRTSMACFPEGDKTSDALSAALTAYVTDPSSVDPASLTTMLDEARAKTMAYAAKELAGKDPIRERRFAGNAFAPYDEMPMCVRRIYLNAALFAPALYRQAKALRKSGLGEEEIVMKLLELECQRYLRYLICESWVYSDEKDEGGKNLHERYFASPALAPLTLMPKSRHLEAFFCAAFAEAYGMADLPARAVETRKTK